MQDFHCRLRARGETGPPSRVESLFSGILSGALMAAINAARRGLRARRLDGLSGTTETPASYAGAPQPTARARLRAPFHPRWSRAAGWKTVGELHGRAEIGARQRKLLPAGDAESAHFGAGSEFANSIPPVLRHGRDRCSESAKSIRLGIRTHLKISISVLTAGQWL